MSKYSDFEIPGKKTRNEQALEESLKEIKNYKNDAVNFNNLEDVYFRDSNLFNIDNQEKIKDEPNRIFMDPRYNQNNTRNESKKQINNIKNIKLSKNEIGGIDTGSNLGSYNETNYENTEFSPLTRDLALSVKSTGNSGKSTGNSGKDPNSLINKVPQLPALKMPNKDITASATKLKILQFKNIPENVQDMIANALIQTWKKDFALKKITSYIGVKNFILHNFKDKLNSFFVLFDDEGDFVGTFAVDTENFAPYISHLFINPNIRNKGFGKKALKYAEKYIAKLGFSSSNLWCEEKLIAYYKKNGYVVDSPLKIAEDMTVWKMCKNLN
jgi:GNAT superfamily N-acetyltransferase